MNILPSKTDFASSYSKNKPCIVHSTMICDTLNPISASLILHEHYKPFFLLESVENAANRGRYSIIGLKPDILFKCDEQHAYIQTDGKDFVQQAEPPLECLRKLYNTCQCDLPESLPPMASGLIGYLSYDAIRFVETSVGNKNPDPINIPIGMFMRPTLMVIFDSVTDSVYVICTVQPSPSLTTEQAYQHATHEIEHIVTLLQSPTPKATHPKVAAKTKPSFSPHMTKEDFCHTVEKAKDYIVAGDIFQIVPSQRFSGKFELPPFAFYRALRHLNPSPFLFFLDFEEFQLVGSSPEILTRLKDGKVTIRPLAGTRKRGKNKEEDEALAKDLLSDQKEIAEHLMLIDLSRNDVGRVAKAGTVKVTEQMTIEYYSHVMHISSNVEGEINPKFDALDVLFSAMPVGTVSGAPKVRAMQLIDELESEKRSFYAGCIGYFSANGTMDTCITLRTGLIKDQTLYLQAGAGIVADSDPESEYEETINKAKALVKAAQMADEFC